MNPKLLLLFVFNAQFCISFAQNQVATDTSVKVFPHWKRGETHSLTIKSSSEEFTEGKADKSMTSFDVRYTITEKDTSGYIVEWIYTKAVLPSNEISLENIILANLLNQKIIFKLTLTGRFVELVNYDEVKSSFDKTIDQLIAGSKNDQRKNLGFIGTKQMLTNRKNMEIVLLKQIKFYNLSFGYKYKKNFTQINALSLPNAIGGKPFDATEKVQLTKLDTTIGVCIVERVSRIDDGIMLKNQIFTYLQKVEKQDSITIRNKFANTAFEFSEKSVQQINYLKGIPQKSNITRVMNFGFENRTSVLEIETIE
jgi:hypothetical protein